MAEPLFIIGAPRSGTTLLRLMLNNHAALRGPHEFPLVHMAVDFFSDRGLGRIQEFLDRLYASPRFESWEIPRNVLDAALRRAPPTSVHGLLRTVFEIYVSQGGAVRYVDKNIGSLSILPEIRALFPDARFIHLVRDGRDVALSLRERPWGQYQLRPFPKRLLGHVSGGGQLWLDALSLVGRFKRLYGPKLLEVRYEDLVREPQAVLSRICAFLGLEFEPAMLEYHLKRDPTISEANLQANHSLLLKQVSSERASRYREALSGNELGLLNELLGDELRSHGYEVNSLAGWRRPPPWMVDLQGRSRFVTLAFQGALRRLRNHGRRR